MTVTLGQRIQSCEAFFLCRVVLTYATCTLHWQHLLTLSSAPHLLSSWCSFPPPRAVLESLTNFMCSLSAAALPASISGSLWRLLKCLQWAGRVTEPGWPWQISDVVFAPFGAIFNDKGDRLCLPITGVGWEANGSFLAKCCHDEALCSGGLLMHSLQLQPRWSRRSLTAVRGFPAVWLLLSELYRLARQEDWLFRGESQKAQTLPPSCKELIQCAFLPRTRYLPLSVY